MSPPMTAFTPNNSSDSSNGLSGFLHKHRFGLRRLHSLMGVIFGGYIVVHLLVNATLLQANFPALFGGDKVPSDVYQSQVDKIHDLPFLVAIEWTAILIPLLFHAGYGILVAISGRQNVTSYGYPKNWAYTLQRASSWVLLLFIAFHVLTMKGVIGGDFGDRVTFIPGLATQTTVNHMHAAWWVGWVIYPIGILAATFHLSNGFWTAGITWGLTITAQAQRLWGFACVGLFAFTTLCGFGSLAATLAAEPDFDGIAAIKQDERLYKEYLDRETPVPGYGELLDDVGDAVTDDN
jgi:succinate dehydrogenase / fumarate reductase cytochrome b subunit